MLSIYPDHHCHLSAEQKQSFNGDTFSNDKMSEKDFNPRLHWSDMKVASWPSNFALQLQIHLPCDFNKRDTSLIQLGDDWDLSFDQ